jgi:hypothetical protein
MVRQSLPPRSVLRARLARGTQLGLPDDEIRDLRSAYHCRAISDHIAEVAERLLPEHRLELAELLAGGDRDAAA